MSRIHCKLVIFFLFIISLSACYDEKIFPLLKKNESSEPIKPAEFISSSPVGVLASNTHKITLKVKTNQSAQCRYSTMSGISYDNMSHRFSTTGGKLHRNIIKNLTAGNEYIYNVRCSVEDVVNTKDHSIQFSIEAKDVSAPEISGGILDDVYPSNTSLVLIELTTNEKSMCRYSETAGVQFIDMSGHISTDDKTHHSVAIEGLSNGHDYALYIRCIDNFGNENTADYPVRFSVEEISIIDKTAPIIRVLSPEGIQPPATQQVILQIVTDENAICRYSASDNAVNGMLFSATGQRQHESLISDLSDGQAYTYFLRCTDESGNINTTAHQINFSVQKLTDLTPPELSEGTPSEPQIANTETVTLSVTTDETAICRYSDTPGMSYENMVNIFNITGSTEHASSVTGLVSGQTYTFYLRCLDFEGNENLIDYGVKFSILSDVAQGTPWSYVGIPYTDWAYNPFTIQPTKPSEWPSAPSQNYYYVEPEHPNASNDIEGAELTGSFGRYGYPNRPRASIPSRGWIGDVYTEGTVVWIKGGTFNGNSNSEATNFYSGWRPQFHGTAEAPVWIYGDPNDKPTFTGSRLQMYNSRYAIIDNLQWIGGNRSNGAIQLTVSDRDGPTHHITLRNLRFENLNYIGGGGAIIGMGATSREGGELHDIVAYNNIFKNNGGGYDWTTVDNDHHGYKINGRLGGNAAYRIWIINNQAIAGDNVDPVDGLYKSLSGNFVQVGDQNASSGNNHHVYVAGNYQEYARQALGWTKKSRDVLFSSNTCDHTFNGAGGNGQCYGHQYGLGDYNWWINNIGRNSASGWMHTANENMTGPLFIIGNLFYKNTNSDRNDNWRTCSGATLYSQHGIHYFVNNVFDSQCHGIWAKTNRHNADDELHIYNNIFTNFSATVDTTAKAISLESSNGIQLFLENNLFGTYSDDVLLNRTTFNTLNDLNATSWANNNLVGDPLYIDQAKGRYNIRENSPAINAGTQRYQSGAADVYQQFIDRYTGDIHYPGDPADYWPKDFLNQERVVGAGIDAGAFERQE